MMKEKLDWKRPKRRIPFWRARGAEDEEDDCRG
jgi:hypothetical protein